MLPSLLGASRPPRFRWLPYAVLAASLALTSLATYLVVRAVDAGEQTRFEDAARETAEAVRTRLDTYVELLRSVAGLLAVRPDVGVEEFRVFVDRLDVQQRYPGIQGIGWSARVTASELPGFIAAARRRVREDFTVWPAGPRPEYHAILLLEPLDRRNRAAIGYDMFSEPGRRAAMERARDRGEPAASGKVTLVQELDPGKQVGFLIYLPVYRTRTTPPDLARRRAELAGFVYSPFRADDLLGGLLGIDLGANFHWRVYDGDRESEARLLHRSGVQTAAGRFTASRTIDVAGRPWRLVFASAPGGGLTSALAAATALFGLTLSAGLFAATLAQARAEERLRESEARLRRLVDANIVGVLAADATGRIVDANDAFLGMVGYTREDLAAGRLTADALTPPDRDVGTLVGLTRASARTPSETEYLRRDGTRVPVLVGTVAIDAPERLALGVIVDLSAQKRVEREREELLARAQAARLEAETASRLKDEFLATMSHELRTPLNAILGWARMLRQGTVGRERVTRALEVIERNALAQARLVSDLLEVSAIVRGKLRLDYADVDLAGVVESALDSVRPAAEAKGVRLTASLARALPALRGDADRLQQVVWNLVANAIKFTPPGGAVDVTLDAANTMARIVVTDTGQGIAPEFLPYVFERFRQSDSSLTRAHGGLGLGLALVRLLVEAHGGRVRAESAGSGLGSRFTVELPLGTGTRLPADLDVLETASATGTDGAADCARLDGVRIVVVDNEPDAAELVATMLEQCGAEVRTAPSAAEGLELLLSWRPDALVSDLAMPVEDGYALLRRAREAGAAMPALALTAHAGADVRKRVLDAGFSAHLVKPVDMRELAAAIAAVAVTPRASGP